jgi:hypothetical protein
VRGNVAEKPPPVSTTTLADPAVVSEIQSRAASGSADES